MPIDIDKAIEIFKRTRSWRRTAALLNCHPFSIQYALSALGYESEFGPGQPRKWDLEKGVALRKEGKTYAQISEILNIPLPTLQRAIKQALRKELRLSKNK